VREVKYEMVRSRDSLVDMANKITRVSNHLIKKGARIITIHSEPESLNVTLIAIVWYEIEG
jgi:hypothetical protein